MYVYVCIYIYIYTYKMQASHLHYVLHITMEIGDVAWMRISFDTLIATRMRVSQRKRHFALYFECTSVH